LKVLLDTCTFLWITQDAEELSEHAKEVFKNPNNEIFLSSVSSWEIWVKHKLGKLILKTTPTEFIPQSRRKHRIKEMNLSESAVLHINKIPDHHNDPFDRMLICQALEEHCVILTPDKLIHKYPVKVEW